MGVPATTMQSSALTIFAACVLAATTINALPLSDSTLLRPGICPGSPAAIHAKSQLTLTFPSPCDVVAELVFSRATSDSWLDPHNGGNYTLLSDNRPSTILMSRAAGSQAKTPKGPNYDDQVKFTFLPTENWGRPDGGCQVRACLISELTTATCMISSARTPSTAAKHLPITLTQKKLTAVVRWESTARTVSRVPVS